MKEDRQILFVDFNGVLSYDPYWKSLKDPKHTLHRYAESIEHFVFRERPELFREWMRGKYSAEEFHGIVAEAVGAPYGKLFQTFAQDCRALDVSELIVNALRPLKSHYRIILATANTDALERFIIPNKKNLFDVFDVIDNSFHTGFLKTDDSGKYFIERARKEGVCIEAASLLEDSEITCDVFRKLGGRAFCVSKELQVLETIALIKNE